MEDGEREEETLILFFLFFVFFSKFSFNFKSLKLCGGMKTGREEEKDRGGQ